jgi:chaperonin cofactor prefoldin
MKMVNQFEEYTENIKKCECGETDIVIEKTSYIFLSRNDKSEIVNEIEGDEEDYKITCKKCEKQLDRW